MTTDRRSELYSTRLSNQRGYYTKGEIEKAYVAGYNEAEEDILRILDPFTKRHLQMVKNQEMEPGEWPNIEKMLRHIFRGDIASGEGLYEFGIEYIRSIYFNPAQRTPVLCLVGRERNTGKSTFLSFLQLIFRDTVSIVRNESFTDRFNNHLAHKLIVALDEGFIPIDQEIMMERLRNYSTDRFMRFEGKGVKAFEACNFTHLIMCSGYEDNFAGIDQDENRFLVLNLPTIESVDPHILQKIEQEIPHFIDYLNIRNIHQDNS